MYTQADLTKLIKAKIGKQPFVVVFQAAPYQHTHTSRGIIAKRHVSGAAAGIEPVVRAAKGLWVAWGRGDADQMVADSREHIHLPPGDPQYMVRPLWLHKHDIDHWYYGFANSALWPLSHVAYVRPEFKLEDWESYQKVNHTFARITLEETEKSDPFIWVHDYQLALVPQYLREKRPEATIGFFWHIPWPNREVFKTCPWRKELLEGLLASNLIGFHIPNYVRAFLESIAQELEAKVNFETNTVEYKGRLTRVRAFPISIDYGAVETAAARGQERGRQILRQLVPAPHRFLAFSADRLDYIKGISERLRAVDRFFEKYPHYRGQLSFLMVQSPSRTRVPAYQNLRRDILDMAERINFKYAADVWSPIYLLERDLEPNDLYSLYRNVDIMVITSVHDGMNLVAKEYVAAAPKAGRLILSQFAGAAQELGDAILINPHDTEATADAIRTAIEMPFKERGERMGRMKEHVKEQNVYRWAGDFITEMVKPESNHGKK